tara:strand:+ start:252 stop:569 length:318 start_codon:yes stop_codon:yes gene_type:complete
MTNSDYLIKATIKKISEKFNQTFIEKVEEAANVAQEVPEIIKKEIETLKEEIIQEAKRLQENELINKNNNYDYSKVPIEKCMEKLDEIKDRLEDLNELLEINKNV